MRKITKYTLLFVIALLLQPYCLFAYESPDIGLSDSSTYSELSAKYGEWANSASHYSLDMLGIIDMDYIGTFNYSEDGPKWQFKTEPEVGEIDPDGPAHGKLKKGDVIVAIDDFLITTEKAGLIFANLTPDEPVEFYIRRRGQTLNADIVPRAISKPVIPIELMVRQTEQLKKENSIDITPGRTILPEYAPIIEKIKKRYMDIGAETDSMGVLASLEYRDRAPRGWIGFGLTFSGSIRRNDNGKPADWLFLELPSIKSIQPGSPADKAGLMVDDVLMEIDGKKLDTTKGGERFSRMEPGQTITWKIRRGDKTFTVETTAIERPSNEEQK